MQAVIFVVAAFAALATAADSYNCTEGLTYDYPYPDNCRYYYHCEPDKEVSVKSCFIFFRRFNPLTLKCDWCWSVDCSAVPPIPTAPPTEAPTEAPTVPSSQAPTEAPTVPSSQAPSGSSSQAPSVSTSQAPPP